LRSLLSAGPGNFRPGVLSASVTSPISDSMVPFPYIIGVIGVIELRGACGGPIEKGKLAGLGPLQSSASESGRKERWGGEGVESYSPYGRIMSGFVSVGDAGRAGYAAIVAVMVSVCCILASAREGRLDIDKRKY
jgi:hypothetical protein